AEVRIAFSSLSSREEPCTTGSRHAVPDMAPYPRCGISAKRNTFSPFALAAATMPSSGGWLCLGREAAGRSDVRNDKLRAIPAAIGERDFPVFDKSKAGAHCVVRHVDRGTTKLTPRLVVADAPVSQP